jgi:hypothetical protein
MGLAVRPGMRKELVELITREMIRSQQLKQLCVQLKEEKRKPVPNDLAIQGIIHQMLKLLPDCIIQPKPKIQYDSGPPKTHRERVAKMPYCFLVSKEA